MRYFFIILFFNIGVISRADSVEEMPADLNEEQQISFYRGYLLWQEYLQRPGVSYNFEQVIAGMRTAEKGGKFPCDEEKLQIKIRQFQEKVLIKQTEDNLADAEAFLAKIANADTVELIPGKLYYKRLENGDGKAVLPSSTPILTYSIWSYDRWGETEIISLEDPTPITLQDTIPGFAQGVSGMREGEVRKLFIHPDLAYGIHGKLGPNLLIIFEVRVVCADHNRQMP